MSASASFRSVADLELSGRRVFLRADLNVPLRDGKVADDTRIRAAQETLNYVRQQGGRIILASHLGRPKGEIKPEYSLRPVAEFMGLPLAADCIGSEVEAQVDALGEGEALLLENLRFHPGEEKNQADFVQSLARLCEVYVNDAFGTAHRAHASTVGLAEVSPVAGAGFLMARELEVLTKIRDQPEHPFVCILGGAKVSDKLAVLESLTQRADAIVIGGAMAFTFLLARGEPVGRSLVELDQVETARRLLAGSCEVILPRDHVVAPEPGAGEQARTVERIPDDQMALDIGPASVEQIRARLADAASVFWNGPLGFFEREPFHRGTQAVAEALAATSAYSVVGGGDLLAAVNKANVAGRISHLSTGGGASLEFLEGRALPGVVALENA